MLQFLSWVHLRLLWRQEHPASSHPEDQYCGQKGGAKRSHFYRGKNSFDQQTTLNRSCLCTFFVLELQEGILTPHRGQNFQLRSEKLKTKQCALRSCVFVLILFIFALHISYTTFRFYGFLIHFCVWLLWIIILLADRNRISIYVKRTGFKTWRFQFCVSIFIEFGPMQWSEELQILLVSEKPLLEAVSSKEEDGSAHAEFLWSILGFSKFIARNCIGAWKIRHPSFRGSEGVSTTVEAKAILTTRTWTQINT